MLGDVLDQMGLRRQFLPPGIAPLAKGMTLVGRAMPVLEADVFSDGDARGARAAGAQALRADAGGARRPAPRRGLRRERRLLALRALWGELMSTRATYLKAAGAVLDGYVRDADGIEALGFPCFCRGVYAQDQGPRGKVVDFRCAIEIGGVTVAAGSLVFGDREGVLVVPREAEAEAVARALEKAETENRVEIAIKGGMSAVEALETFGVM